MDDYIGWNFNSLQGRTEGGGKGAGAPSLNTLMVEIGKILSEIGDKSGKICKKTDKTDFEHPLE